MTTDDFRVQQKDVTEGKNESSNLNTNFAKVLEGHTSLADTAHSMRGTDTSRGNLPDISLGIHDGESVNTLSRMKTADKAEPSSTEFGHLESRGREQKTSDDKDVPHEGSGHSGPPGGRRELQDNERGQFHGHGRGGRGHGGGHGGFQSEEGGSLDSIISHGGSAQQVLRAGGTAEQVRIAGGGADLVIQAGGSADQIRQAGGSTDQIKAAGGLIEQSKPIGGPLVEEEREQNRKEIFAYPDHPMPGLKGEVSGVMTPRDPDNFDKIDTRRPRNPDIQY